MKIAEKFTTAAPTSQPAKSYIVAGGLTSGCGHVFSRPPRRVGTEWHAGKGLASAWIRRRGASSARRWHSKGQAGHRAGEYGNETLGVPDRLLEKGANA